MINDEEIKNHVLSITFFLLYRNKNNFIISKKTIQKETSISNCSQKELKDIYPRIIFTLNAFLAKNFFLRIKNIKNFDKEGFIILKPLYSISKENLNEKSCMENSLFFIIFSIFKLSNYEIEEKIFLDILNKLFPSYYINFVNEFIGKLQKCQFIQIKKIDNKILYLLNIYIKKYFDEELVDNFIKTVITK